LAKVRQALMGGFAASRILEVHGERTISFNPVSASAEGLGPGAGGRLEARRGSAANGQRGAAVRRQRPG
jgi:hypothetical protein